jgi:hypothetical protein
MTGNLAMMAGDLLGLALASALGLVLLLMPGALVAACLHRLVPTTDWRAFAPALAVAVLPLLDAYVIRFGGIECGIAVRLVLAALTLIFARDFIPRCGRVAAGGLVLWFLYLGALYVDIDVGGRLYQSITVLDLVKHAAVVREIGLHGVPLHDPFFARAEAAGYYHYFYDGAAILDVSLGRLADARMAFVGAAFAVGVAVASLLRALVVELGWQRSSDRRLTALVILACAIGGLDLLGIAARWAATGLLEANAEWWDDEISFVPVAASWVPHHLAGVVGSFVALLALAKATQADTPSLRVLLAAFAGVAMASVFGLTIWVALGAAVVLAAALRFLPRDLWMKWIASVTIAGVVALVLSAPQLADLIQGRAGQGAPIWLWIREPGRIGEVLGHPPSPLLSLALTPPALLLEFGAFALGAWLFSRRGDWANSSLPARLLVAAFAAGLLMNLLLRSTIINNDFGWRAAWFAQLPAMVWTIAVLQRPLPQGVWRGAMYGALALGFAASLYNVLAARLVRPPVASHQFGYINADPAMDYALARAYRWASREIPAGRILQHNPLTAPRIFNFGLYGHHRVAVADGEAMLFGAPPAKVADRLKTFEAVFSGRIGPDAAGSVHLLVTDRDPLWRRLASHDCLYRADRVCITKGTHR